MDTKLKVNIYKIIVAINLLKLLEFKFYFQPKKRQFNKILVC